MRARRGEAAPIAGVSVVGIDDGVASDQGQDRSRPRPSATPSRVPNPSRCSAPALVMRPISGRAMCSQIVDVARCYWRPSRSQVLRSARIAIRVSGMPISLLKLPCVDMRGHGAKDRRGQRLHRGLAVAEPVMPTTRTRASPRARRGEDHRGAFCVSSTIDLRKRDIAPDASTRAADGTALCSGGDEVMGTDELLPGSATKSRRGVRRARIDGKAGDLDVGAMQAACGSRGRRRTGASCADSLGALAIGSRATARSSKGNLPCGPSW